MLLPSGIAMNSVRLANGKLSASAAVRYRLGTRTERKKKVDVYVRTSTTKPWIVDSEKPQLHTVISSLSSLMTFLERPGWIPPTRERLGITPTYLRTTRHHGVSRSHQK